jgi:hypothetical protein
VFEKGREVNPRLRELPNVVLLPHMGSATRERGADGHEMGEKVIINIKTFADGHRPPGWTWSCRAEMTANAAAHKSVPKSFFIRVPHQILFIMGKFARPEKARLSQAHNTAKTRRGLALFPP